MRSVLDEVHFQHFPPLLMKEHMTMRQQPKLYFFYLSHTIFAGRGPFPTLPPSPNEGLHEPCHDGADCCLQLLFEHHRCFTSPGRLFLAHLPKWLIPVFFVCHWCPHTSFILLLTRDNDLSQAVELSFLAFGVWHLRWFKAFFGWRLESISYSFLTPGRR